MRKPIIFMFSGQGSQYYQMAYSIYKESTLFRSYLDKADIIFQKYTNNSLLAKIYNINAKITDPLDITLYTHPALFIIQFALAMVLIDLGIVPNEVLGTSLGEIVAAAVANVITWQQGLLITIYQAQTISDHCSEGKMCAVLTNESLYYDNTILSDNLDLAANNFTNNFVLSGGNLAINRAISWLKQQSITTFKLPVSHAFHSKQIDPVSKSNKKYLDDVTLNKPNFNIISCGGDLLNDEPKQNVFWNAIRYPILFQQTISRLETNGSRYYIDLGPSGTLATFLKYILNRNGNSLFTNTLSPMPHDNQSLRFIVNKIKSMIEN